MTSVESGRFAQVAVVRAPASRERRAYDLSKRVLDVLLACLGLLVLCPVLLVLAVSIRLTSPGPALFRQTRVGRDGSPFTILKLRTMTTGCSDAVHREYVTALLTGREVAEEGLYKLASDPRITRLGAFLRKASLDELPQLVNVLRGQMSLVGPRPLLPWEASMLEADVTPRFTVLPGVTGLWQTSGRNALTMKQALALDVDYVSRRSLWLDLRIIAKTFAVVLRRGEAG